MTRFDNGLGGEWEDPLTEGTILGRTADGVVRTSLEGMDRGRLQPVVSPTVGDFLTLPPGTEVLFYQAKPNKGEPGVYVAIVTQDSLNAWKDLDQSTSMGWSMLFYLLPEDDSPKGPF